MTTKKQEVVKRTLDFSNVVKAEKKNQAEKKGKKKYVRPTSKVKFLLREANQDRINLTVHKDVERDYEMIRQYFVKEDVKFSDGDLFWVGTRFLKKDFEKKGIYLECPEGFKASALSSGRRETHHRTFPAKEKVKYQFEASHETLDIYMNLMYSFVFFNAPETIYDKYYTRPYFFYDFVEMLKNNFKKLKKENLKFVIPKS